MSDTNQRRYLNTVAELQALAKSAPNVTQEWILEVASMDPEEMRRRLIRGYDWHRAFDQCLDNIKEIKNMPGAAPNGCWGPKEIRNVVETLTQVCSVTWENTCFPQEKKTLKKISP